MICDIFVSTNKCIANILYGRVLPEFVAGIACEVLAGVHDPIICNILYSYLMLHNSYISSPLQYSICACFVCKSRQKHLLLSIALLCSRFYVSLYIYI